MVDCGTVEVLSAFDPSAVAVSGCSVSPTNVSPGELVRATATVQNNNSQSRAQATLRFTAGGTTADDTVTVPPGGSATASATFQFSSNGDYSVDVLLDSVSEA